MKNSQLVSHYLIIVSLLENILISRMMTEITNHIEADFRIYEPLLVNIIPSEHTCRTHMALSWIYFCYRLDYSLSKNEKYILN